MHTAYETSWNHNPNTSGLDTYFLSFQCRILWNGKESGRNSSWGHQQHQSTNELPPLMVLLHFFNRVEKNNVSDDSDRWWYKASEVVVICPDYEPVLFNIPIVPITKPFINHKHCKLHSSQQYNYPLTTHDQGFSSAWHRILPSWLFTIAMEHHQF